MNIATFSARLQQGAAHPVGPGLALAALSIALLAGAYAFEYLVGLKPCPLCLEQRVPWFVMIGLGGAIVGANNPAAPRMLLIGLYVAAIGVALWSTYLGGYHAGVEYKWWLGPQTCTSGGGLPTDGPLLGPISSSDVVFCDKVPWSLFGISLAGFNFLFSLVAVGVAAIGLRAALRRGA
jgi:disulfide bond formation protein DsbB